MMNEWTDPLAEKMYVYLRLPNTYAGAAAHELDVEAAEGAGSLDIVIR